MPNQAYQQYLVSDHWKQLRFAKLKESGFKCEKCRSTKNLQVHHLTYQDLLNIELRHLQVLCAICHGQAHGRIASPPLERRIGSLAFGLFKTFLRQAPTAGRKSMFNWAIRQTRKRLSESGRLTKQLDAELLSIRK